jgi:hypothetical protein
MRSSSFRLLALASVFLAPTLHAQESAAPLELSANYSYIRFNIDSRVAGQPPSQTFNANGGAGDVIYNPTNWLGLVGDAGGFWATNARAYGAAIPLLAGPRFNFRRRPFTPFVQTLFGGVVTSSGIGTSGWQAHFALAAGGGIDYKLSPHFSLRPLQVQYFMTKVPDGLNNRQNNFQVSTGVSFLFGHK